MVFQLPADCFVTAAPAAQASASSGNDFAHLALRRISASTESQIKSSICLDQNGGAFLQDVRAAGVRATRFSLFLISLPEFRLT